MSKFFERARAPPSSEDLREPPADCLECRMVGSGAMASLSLYFFYHAQRTHTSAKPSHLRFNAALSVVFAAASVTRWFA